MVVRAVHFELVENMSTDEFPLCLHHFIAHCGIPSQTISDIAKQFKAAKQVLSKARLKVSDCVDDYLCKQGIHWKFLVELAPQIGGFYKYLVGLTKIVIRKTLGSLLEKSMQLL